MAVLSPALKSRLCLLVFLFAVLFKFVLIWQSEIVDAIDDPHEYVLQILHPVNGGLAYPPGTGLVGRLFRDLGIPFRLGIETAFLAASALVLRSLFAWPWKSYLAFGLFLVTVFDPAPVELFSHLYSDQVWLIETMLGLACFVLAFRDETKLNWNQLVLSLFFFSFSMLTRSVAIPLLLSANLFALFALALTLAKYRSKALKRILDLWAVAIPALILGICLIYGGICRYNFLRHGYSGLSYVDSNEYKTFYLRLQSVGDPTGAPYFPIDENRRRLIARAGPDSKWFIRQLDENVFYQQVGLDHYGTFDIPAGWFHWATFTAAMTHGDYMASFALFKNIEDEITTSGRAGVIKVRPVVSLPDSRISIVCAAFPDGLRHAIGQIAAEPAADSFTWKAGRYLNPEFTTALTRRTVRESPWREKIWQDLTVVYAYAYTPAAFYLYLAALALFVAVLILKWKRIEVFSPVFLARQFFTIFFLVFLFWYTLFDASGMPVTSRYMIFNHVMLPILLCYYLTIAVRLLKKQPL